MRHGSSLQATTHQVCGMHRGVGFFHQEGYYILAAAGSGHVKSCVTFLHSSTAAGQEGRVV